MRKILFLAKDIEFKKPYFNWRNLKDFNLLASCFFGPMVLCLHVWFYFGWIGGLIMAFAMACLVIWATVPVGIGFKHSWSLFFGTTIEMPKARWEYDIDKYMEGIQREQNRTQWLAENLKDWEYIEFLNGTIVFLRKSHAIRAKLSW